MQMLVLIVAAALTGLQPAPQPYTDSPEIPATAAYRRAQEVAALINAADPGRLRTYVQEHFAPDFRDAFPMEDHLGIAEEVHGAHGDLKAHSARSYTPARPATQAVLILRGAVSESWVGIIVDVEPEPPHRIASLQFAPARPPSDLPGGEALTDAQIAEQLGDYVDRLAGADAFSGTVLLARHGKVLTTRAVGLANRDFGVPNRLDTKFNLGSMNKMLTAVAMARLVEQGKVSFDDPLGMYVGEDWLPREALESIRVRHLLSHTSGLGSYFNQQFFRSSRALYRVLDDYRPLVQGERLAFTPGTDWRYSNTGFLIAGVVIERASGMDYFRFVREQVTGPAGMTGTDCYELDRVNENLAVGYERRRTPEGQEFRNNIFTHVLRGGPAGGGYSTVEDLLRFDQALRSGGLVGREMLENLWNAHPEVGSPDYGYGFGVQVGPAGRVVGHSGGFEGISAHLQMYLDAGYTVAVLSNYGGAAGLVESKARALIAQAK